MESTHPQGKCKFSMACFLVTLRLGLHDLLSHHRLVLVMALSIAIATSMLAIVEAYRTGLAAEFDEQMATANLNK